MKAFPGSPAERPGSSSAREQGVCPALGPWFPAFSMKGTGLLGETADAGAEPRKGELVLGQLVVLGSGQRTPGTCQKNGAASWKGLPLANPETDSDTT